LVSLLFIGVAYANFSLMAILWNKKFFKYNKKLNFIVALTAIEHILFKFGFYKNNLIGLAFLQSTIKILTL
jgi:hypothetical protein